MKEQPKGSEQKGATMDSGCAPVQESVIGSRVGAWNHRGADAVQGEVRGHTCAEVYAGIGNLG